MSNPLLEFLRTHEESFRSRARLASLYSDFASQRSTNPENYAANSAAWLKALTLASRDGLLPSQNGASNRFVLHTGNGLARALETEEFGQPLSLGNVMQDAVAEHKLVPLKDFLQSKKSICQHSWLPTPWQALSWGLRVIGIQGNNSPDRLIAGDFVVIENVEHAAKAVAAEAEKVVTSSASAVYSRELFVSTFGQALGAEQLSHRDFEVLLTHLSRDRHILAYSAATGTIKFETALTASPEAITPEDVSIANLRTLISSLGPQVAQLESRVTELDKNARAAVSAKQLQKAKTALRSKKLAETTLSKRTALLQQLEEVYTKIEQAADNVHIVQVLEASSKTLASLNEKSGGVEHVQDVMEDLKEQMMDTEEIQNAITEPAAGSIDEGEVDDELEALEKVEREKEAELKRKEEEAKRKEEEEKVEREAEEIRKRFAQLEQPPVQHVQETDSSSAKNEKDTVMADNDVVQTS